METPCERNESDMKHKKSFNQLLQETAVQNRSFLMQKAKDANRLAKSVSGRNRRKSYQVKVTALKALATKFASDVRILADRKTPNMIVVSVEGAGFGLHAPGYLFDI